MRRVLAVLTALLLTPGVVVAQERAYTVDELESGCTENAPSDMVDSCLFLLHEVILKSTTGPTADGEITLNGSGSTKSAPFTLAGGDYRAQATASNDGPCYAGLHLVSNDGLVNESAGVVDLSGGTADGESYIYGISGGRYHIEAIAGCDWSVTISPA